MPRPRLQHHCKQDGCPNQHQAQGYCPKHYIAARRAGTIQLVQGKKK